MERARQHAFALKQRKVTGELLKRLAPTIGTVPWAEGRMTVLRRETQALLKNPDHVPSMQAIKVLTTMAGISHRWAASQATRSLVRSMVDTLEACGVEFHAEVIELFRGYRARLDDLEWEPGEAVLTALVAYGDSVGLAFDDAGVGVGVRT